MSCDKIQSLLNDYIDNELPVLHVEVVKKHCDSCESCAARLAGLRAQKLTLQSLPIVPASEGFEKNVVKAAIRDAKSTPYTGAQRPALLKFAAVAMISALIVWVGLINKPSDIDDSLVMVNVGADVQTIKVAIDSEKAIQAVSLRVDLSDNLELAGFGNKKQISWNADLQKGVNVISLPIVGIAQGKGDITTRIHLNGEEKVMHIKTQYKVPDSVLYEDSAVLQS